MRKTALVILFASFLLFSSTVNGQELKQIQNLKDKLASKVAELRTKNVRGYSGEVTQVGKGTLKLKGSDGKNYDVRVDSQITNFYQIQGASKKELASDDLKKGNYVIVTGPLNGSTITANYIYVDEQVLAGSGKVTEVNSTDSYIKVAGVDNESYTLDIETSTKKLLLDIKTLELDTATLLKFKEGDTVHFLVKRTGKEVEKNRYTATKVLIIPQEYFIKPK